MKPRKSSQSSDFLGPRNRIFLRKGRIFFWVFLLLLLFSVTMVSAEIKIEKKAIVDSVVPEINNSGIYELKITNLGEDDSFNVYSLVGVKIMPNESFSISSGETKTLEVELMPEEAILKKPGTFNFIYKIKGEKSGIKEDAMLVRIVNLKDALYINSYNINLESDEAVVYAKNMISLTFPEIKADFHSAFFDFSEVFSLGKYEQKEFNIALNKEKMKGLVAGSYILTTNVETYNVKETIENTFRFTEKSEITTEEASSGFLILTRTIKKINDGNIASLVQVKINKNIISRLFTTFNIEPARVERNGFAVYYTFQKEIQPGETLTVKTTTSWLYPLILIAVIVFVVYLMKIYTSTDLLLKKRVNYIRTKGGEFAFKVSLIVKAKRYAEKINVVDRIPSLVKVHERFGAIPPDKIDEKNRRLEWSIDSLQPGEERVFSYIVYSRISPVGKFELPHATAVFEKDGKIHEAESNRVFFLTEPRKREEAY